MNIQTGGGGSSSEPGRAALSSARRCVQIPIAAPAKRLPPPSEHAVWVLGEGGREGGRGGGGGDSFFSHLKEQRLAARRCEGAPPRVALGRPEVEELFRSFTQCSKMFCLI